MSRTSLVLLAIFASSHAAPAGEVTLPASKFPFCLAARTKTLDCAREKVTLSWSCTARSASQATVPKCSSWEIGEIAVTCSAWTDGSYFYGGQSGDNPTRRADVIEPVYMCVKQRPDSEIRAQFHFTPGSEF